jgi:DNA anti-recombination protein RmuC
VGSSACYWQRVIFVAAFVSQSSHIDPAKLTVVRWVAQLGSTSSEPLTQSERRVPRGASDAQLNGAEPMASQATPSPQTTPQEGAATASLSFDQAQMLQAMARDLAKLGERIEELNTRQEQMAGENAKAIEQQDQLARENIKAIQQLERSQEQVVRDNAKTAEEIKAGREQMAGFLAATASEQNLQPKTPALKPRPIAAPKH